MRTYHKANIGPKRAGIYKTQDPGWLRIVSPYDSGFVDGLKTLNQPSYRRWEPTGKFWLVNEICLDILIDLCETYFDEVEHDLMGVASATTGPNIFTQMFTGLSQDEGVKVYRALASVLHPDKGGNSVLMTQLNNAYHK